MEIAIFCNSRNFRTNFVLVFLFALHVTNFILFPPRMWLYLSGTYFIIVVVVVNIVVVFCIVFVAVHIGFSYGQ